MSKSCDLLINKKSRVGNSVSHSNIKTKRMFHVNLQNVCYFSDVLNKKFHLKVSIRAMRTINKYGGFDGFLSSIRLNRLTDFARKVKKLVLKASAPVNS